MQTMCAKHKLLGGLGVTYFAQDIRVGFYDGVAPGIVALDGRVH